jgi:hypothetical protein
VQYGTGADDVSERKFEKFKEYFVELSKATITTEH